MLEAAADAIAESGVAAVSLREIARRAGVSHATPGHHFAHKAGLLTAVATDGFERFAGVLDQRAPNVEGDEPLDRLVAAGLAYVSFAIEHWAVFELMFRRDVIDVRDPAYLASAARTRAVLVERVSAAQQTGWAGNHDTEVLVTLCWALVHGCAALMVQGALPPDSTDVAALLRMQLALLGSSAG